MSIKEKIHVDINAQKYSEQIINRLETSSATINGRGG